MMNTGKRQNGFSLITAIFLVVIVASVGAFMVTINQTQQQSTSFSLLGMRAMQAASSGIEWAIHRATQSGGAGLNCGAAGVPFTVNTGNAFTVTVTCNVLPFEEGTSNYNVYELTAVAEFGAVTSPDYISRRLRASVCESCP